MTYSMRKKEGLSDYRYFQEPDIPLVYIRSADIDNIKNLIPELPHQRRKRYIIIIIPILQFKMYAIILKVWAP